MTAVLAHNLTGGVTGPTVDNAKTLIKTWGMINGFATPAAWATTFGMSTLTDLAVGVYSYSFISIRNFQNYNAFAYQHDTTQYSTNLVSASGGTLYCRKCVGNANADGWTQFGATGDLI